ncbi:MAG TPA: glycosyltransferase [Bryobacteraceae bacterium]|jgi:trehalose synthase
MPIRLEDYQEFTGPGVIEELRALAGRVAGRSMQHINSTSVGGGVAEILTRLVPLLRELGVNATWDVIKGDQAFFSVTKAFHNALHGKPEEITAEMYEIFRANTETNLRDVNLTGDAIFVHDPQPAGLVARKQDIGRRWVWRCHIDISAPQPDVWKFLRPSIEQYDAAIFSMPDFAQRLPVAQFRIAPSIDPLSDKNKPLDSTYVAKVLEKYHIDPGRPVLTQISRFDRFKDPVGVIAAYRMVKKRRRCQLVLAGGGAPDDPEGDEVLRDVQQAAADDPDIHVLLLPPFSDLEINALVRGSTVVIQKSIREGFGLTVSEALWKKKAVLGGATGGIKLQIIDGITGFLVHSAEGAATRITQLLGDRRLRDRMGENGYQHVRQNFLLTRHVRDYILTMLALEHPGESMIHLA